MSSGVRTSGVSSLGPASSQYRSSGVVENANVVQLRPLSASGTPQSSYEPASSPSTVAINYLDDVPPADERDILQAWAQPSSPGVGKPRSTADARERRRQVLLGLTAIAFITLLPAIYLQGAWIAAHVLVDMITVGYVILLVRHRQMTTDRLLKVEPIRPPVSEQPANVQLAPAYLLRSNTGS